MNVLSIFMVVNFCMRQKVVQSNPAYFLHLKMCVQRWERGALHLYFTSDSQSPCMRSILKFG